MQGLPGRRVLLAAVAASLVATALLAIGILLLGDFGETEGRILGTTMMLAGYGLLALPAGFLLDQRRARGLAVALLAGAGSGFALGVSGLWSGDDAPGLLEDMIPTVTVWTVAGTQVAALTARRREGDPRLVARLFGLSCVLAATAASLVTVAVWAEIESQGFFRALAALAVLDVLIVALQPLLAARASTRVVHGIRLVVEPSDVIETTVEAPDFATAVATAIRDAERAGQRVVLVERAGARSNQ